MPESRTLRGLLAALLVTLTLPARVPAAAGVNVTWKLQLLPGAKVLAPNEHGLLPVGDSAKSAAFAPVTLVLLTFSVALPLFVSVTPRGLLEVLTGWLPKLRLAGFKVTAGPWGLR